MRGLGADDYYNPNNSYIDVVLETKLGIPISLCLLYTSVLARLGVTCKPVNFPGEGHVHIFTESY